MLAGNKNTRLLTFHNFTFSRSKRPSRVSDRVFTGPFGRRFRATVSTGRAEGVFSHFVCCLVPRREMSGWDCARLARPLFFAFNRGLGFAS